MKADADMEDLIGKALNQNFVPVLDDQKCFIGIITRKDIIQYFYKKASSLRKSGLNARRQNYQKQLLDKMHKEKNKTETLCTLLGILCYYNRRNPPIHYIVFATPHRNEIPSPEKDRFPDRSFSRLKIPAGQGGEGKYQFKEEILLIF